MERFDLLIPFIRIPELTLLDVHQLHVFGHLVNVGPITIKPFGALVATGVYLTFVLGGRYAKRRGVDPELQNKFMFWVAGFAFALGHMLDTIFYHPDILRADPMSLFRIWDGLSSFGGFTGAAVGVLAFKLWYGAKNVLPLADTAAAAFPIGWTFGRMGCSVVHDHPGIRSDVWFAVAYPGGSRFDLGLYEMVFALTIALVTFYLVRRPKPPGFFLGFTMLVYAPVRFSLDFLRIQPGWLFRGAADPRYAGLTPGQWASMAMALAGFWLLTRAANSGEVGDEPFLRAQAVLGPKVLGPKTKTPDATT